MKLRKSISANLNHKIDSVHLGTVRDDEFTGVCVYVRVCV